LIKKTKAALKQHFPNILECNLRLTTMDYECLSSKNVKKLLELHDSRIFVEGVFESSGIDITQVLPEDILVYIARNFMSVENIMRLTEVVNHDLMLIFRHVNIFIKSIIRRIFGVKR
jgi:hypothetical protein